MTPPRLLVVMGSGETSPTMVTTHQQLLRRLGPAPVPAVLLDTPFGFQENADELTARAVGYFADSVGAPIEPARFRSASDAADTLAHEQMLSQLRQARYVFAGPGSPTYALSQWRGTAIPDILAEKLERGGCVTFASAAALTVGMVTVPVYEIYKVGIAPHWQEGLDLLSRTGLRAAVIPHYNNAEGGTHDTRYCYLGERRLAAMETELPDDAFVLGVDEHTGCVLDLDAGTATVVGLGVLTVRRDGRSHQVPSGEQIPIADLARMAERAATGGGRAPAGPDGGGAGAEADRGGRGAEVGASAPSAGGGPSPLMRAVRALQDDFDRAIAAADADGAVRAVLALDDELTAWATDTLQSDELDRGRAVLRSMVVRLGEVAATGLRDPRQVVGPYVDVVLAQRTRARSDKRWAEADELRDALGRLGVEIHDTPEGTAWELAGPGC